MEQAASSTLESGRSPCFRPPWAAPWSCPPCTSGFHPLSSLLRASPVWMASYNLQHDAINKLRNMYLAIFYFTIFEKVQLKAIPFKKIIVIVYLGYKMLKGWTETFNKEGTIIRCFARGSLYRFLHCQELHSCRVSVHFLIVSSLLAECSPYDIHIHLYLLLWDVFVFVTK